MTTSKEQLETKVVNLIDNWQTAVEMLIVALEKGNETGKTIARGELRRMAKLADMYVATVGDE
jgi:hypothetical protein